MRLRALIVFGLVAALAASATGLAQPANATHGRVFGVITNATTGAPIDGVCVALEPPITCTTTTNAAGQYSLNFSIPDGLGLKFAINFLKAGQFQPEQRRDIAGDVETQLNIAMTPVPGATPVPSATPAPVVVAPPTVNIEQRIADFWKRIDALAPTDNVSAGDLGQWALNVIERNPRARLTAADFRTSTAQMQAGLDRAGLGPVPAVPPTPIANIEQKIADFWTRIDALAPGDYVSAGDLGQWALNVIARIPRAQLSVTDFRASTAGMQAGFDRAGLAP